ncbi:hypothetical protein BPOR_0273g00030 [Botrytis porri]|uniref:Uncharacterized protein n=1 Tax=Botrytis porri TaxID=87229 RepID=A0A4Z1KRA4_9HELO|nr:hypothetical protein BPOR_0273g00030 [Botrytis porri]
MKERVQTSKVCQEYADRDRLLWQETMQDLHTQTADRKVVREKEEDNVAKLLPQTENEILEKEQQAKKVKEATELRRMLMTLNKEAAADTREGGKRKGKKSKGHKTSQSTGIGENSVSRGNSQRRQDQTTGTDQSSKG